jgi:hypothetical protein
VCPAFQRLYSSQGSTVSEQALSIHEGGGRKVGKFEGEERLVMRSHSTFLSREEHKVAAGALFNKVEGKKYCAIRKALLDNYIFVFTVLTI